MGDMDEEIRESSEGDVQDNIQEAAGTKKLAPGEPAGAGHTKGGGGGGTLPGTDSPQAEEAREEFPRASESETIQAAEDAKAAFGGAGGGGGGGVESDADPAIATGQKPGMGSETDQEASADAPSRAEVDDAGSVEEAEVAEEKVEESREGITTGQMAAGILGSDEGMQWESKIADKMSGGDDKNT
jgi:hypothetical protein